jgi:IS5 family transposase
MPECQSRLALAKWLSFLRNKWLSLLRNKWLNLLRNEWLSLVKIIHLVKHLNPIPKSYQEELDVLYRVLTQKRDDKNKVYSVHEPETLCISKGKEHKPYEFGNKSSFAYTRESGIIVGSMAIDGNIYDGRTLKPQLDQVKELTGEKIKKAIVDKGYKVPGGIPGIEIVMPKVLKGESYYKKKKRE